MGDQLNYTPGEKEPSVSMPQSAEDLAVKREENKKQVEKVAKLRQISHRVTVLNSSSEMSDEMYQKQVREIILSLDRNIPGAGIAKRLEELGGGKDEEIFVNTAYDSPVSEAKILNTLEDSSPLNEDDIIIYKEYTHGFGHPDDVLQNTHSVAVVVVRVDAAEVQVVTDLDVNDVQH
ncbi:hypothetical protein KJ632_03415 [Patescibacteria group bacterium]|nr:hypothetical protein [Patescibacteria group bacterium]